MKKRISNSKREEIPSTILLFLEHMAVYQQQKAILIKASPEKVWEVMGKNVADAWKRATSVTHSEWLSFDKAWNCTERACDTSFGKIKEHIDTLDHDHRILSYSIYTWLPWFVKKAKNTWKIYENWTDETLVFMDLEMETWWLMWAIMWPMFNMNIKKTLNEATEELKWYIEKWKAHPRKQKQLGNR